MSLSSIPIAEDIQSELQAVRVARFETHLLPFDSVNTLPPYSRTCIVDTPNEYVREVKELVLHSAPCTLRARRSGTLPDKRYSMCRA